MSKKTARRAKCGTETLLVGTQLNPWSNFLFFHADSVIICISLHVLVMLVEILLNTHFIFSGSACFLILLKNCSFMLVLNAIRHIWHSHTVRCDNVINQDFVFYHCSLKGQNDLFVDNIS